MISIPYTVHVDIDDDIEYDYVSEFVCPLDIKDIIIYEYKNKYNEAFKEMSWWLLPGAKEFVKELENAWLHNQIDEFKYKNNSEFIEMLKDIHKNEIYRQEKEELNVDDILKYDEREETYYYDDEEYFSKEDFLEHCVNIEIGLG